MQNNRRRIGPKPISPEDPSICIKFSLFFLNVLFWLAAILILSVGVYMMVEKRDAYENYLSFLELDPAVLLVFLGTALFLITGFLGSVLFETTRACFAFMRSFLVCFSWPRWFVVRRHLPSLKRCTKIYRR